MHRSNQLPLVGEKGAPRSWACWLELELDRDAWLVSVVAASVVGPCRRARTHILSTGGSFLLLECGSAGVSF